MLEQVYRISAHGVQPIDDFFVCIQMSQLACALLKRQNYFCIRRRRLRAT